MKRPHEENPGNLLPVTVEGRPRCYVCGKVGSLTGGVIRREVRGYDVHLCSKAYQGFVFFHSGCLSGAGRAVRIV